MVGSHAQIVNVDRVEGVPVHGAAVLRQVAVRHAGPRRFHRLGALRHRRDATEQQGRRARLRADVPSPPPDALAAASPPRSAASSCSRNGVASGTRRVPLRYPMTSAGAARTLQLGGSVDDARRAGKVAVLDTGTRELTAVRAGAVTVTAEADSMRDPATTSPRSRAPRRSSSRPYVAPRVEGRRRQGAGDALLTLGSPPSSAPSAGRARNYTASTPRPVTSTVGEATLTWQVARCPTARSRSLSRSRSRARRLHRPVTSDTFALAFQQQIAATEPLRTGTYSRTLTFTLSTSTP